MGGPALSTVLDSTARLADSGCLLAPGSASDIPLSIKMGFSIDSPNLPSQSPHLVPVHSAEGAALGPKAALGEVDLNM